MTRMDALRALREKVAEGEWDFSPDAPARVVFPYKSATVDDLGLTAREAFDGSLDAAKALHEAVLPGYVWLVLSANAASVGIGAEVYSGDADTPARAWILAILDALIAQGDKA